jgi:hypothetical protein
VSLYSAGGLAAVIGLRVIGPRRGRAVMAALVGCFSVGCAGMGLAQTWYLLNAVAIVAGLGSCGSGQRQDATVPSGSFPVQVANAGFANHQELAETNDLQLEIRNAGNQTVPNLTVTINTVAPGEPNLKSPAYSTSSGQGSFNIRVDEPNLAFPYRPVWILEEGYPKVIEPGQPLKELAKTPTPGAASAATDTFQFGSVEPNQSKDIAWRLTPVRAGTYTVRYQVSASLTGKAKAVTPDGGPVKGEFVVKISAKPPHTCVTGGGKVTTHCGPSAGG